MAYDRLKALHVAAVLVWFGGLLAQSIAVAAATRGGGAPAADGSRLVAAVRSWDRRVTSPALVLVWALGVAVAIQGGWFRSGWLQAKLALVVLLSGLHGVQAGVLRRLSTAPETGAPPPPALGWTPLAAALSAAAIAVLAVAKPF